MPRNGRSNPRIVALIARMASKNRALEVKLQQLDAQIRRLPGQSSTKFERAKLLDALGRAEAASKAYREVLTLAPEHFGAMNDLGKLLFKMGQKKEAVLLFAEAAERFPESPIAHANLGYILLKYGELTLAREHYATALKLDPQNVEAQRGLAAVLLQFGDTATAATIASAAGTESALTTIPFRGDGRALSVLLPVSLGAGNIAVERLLDDRTFEVHKLVVEFWQPGMMLPQHALIFNGVGDADGSADALARVREILNSTKAPVINQPERIAATTRSAVAARLRGSDGLVVPTIVRLERNALTSPDAQDTLQAHGLGFPVLIRSLGYHTGKNFVRVEQARELAAEVAPLPGDELLAIEFLDVRDANGNVRKYRMMFIDGAMYPLHTAVSKNWKVHYFNADMSENAANRDEDAAFLNDPTAVIGECAMRTLAHIGETLGLDYAGVDFALDRDRQVALFEANATMIVVPPPNDPRWAYRRAPVDRVLNAVRTMAQRVSGRIANR